MLKYIYSTMFAGKSAQLIKVYDMYSRKGLKPLVLKPSTDTREEEAVVRSRLMPQNKIKCTLMDKMEYVGEAKGYNSILVDEAQFMTREDVEFLAKLSVRRNIPILCYGLKTDINGNLFEGSSALLALADEITEMDSLCQIEGCNKKATMHLRFVDGELEKRGNGVEIEKGNVTYRAVCYKHWLEMQR